MKILRSILLFSLLLSLLAPNLTFAFDGQVLMEKQVKQGNAFEVKIPKNEYLSINGSFMEQPVKFFEFEDEANWDDPVSRGVFLDTVIDNKEDLPRLVFENPYLDIDKDDKYYREILLATQLGIVKGNYVDYVRLFKPNTSVTRAEAAKMLYQAYNLTSLKREMEATDPEKYETLSNQTFPDLTKNHPLYFYMMECVKAGIFKGYDDGLIRPNAPINYNETEIIVARATGKDKIAVDMDKDTEYYRALVGVDRRWEPGTYYLNLKLENEDGEMEYYTEPIEVLNTEFITQSFRTSADDGEEDKTYLLYDGSQDRAYEKLYEAVATTNDSRYYEEDFQIPAEGYTTLGFGDILYINGIYSGSHSGIDYANETGTDIYASNTGKVVLAEFTDFWGNMVVIDHGENLFSVYIHLDELKCEVDDKVKKGELIGLMGTTGFSTGSHLHYSVMVGTTFVDPAQFYEEAK